jgi:hypothetical protein
VRKSLPPFLLAIAAAVLMIFTVSAGNNKAAANLNGLRTMVKASFATTDSNTAIDNASSVEAVCSRLYDSLNLDDLGLSKEAMLYAYKGFQHLVDNGTLNKDNILTICDFSQSSRKKRMYVIDVKNYKVLLNTYVAHGRNSGVDMATQFSNKPESLESSLGFYVTKSPYTGKHGLSLKIDGLEKGWNDNAEERAVVVHGAAYIGDQRVNSDYMGRSFGCPAVPQKEVSKLISMIKEGTCLFIYHPTERYLHDSKILNG